MPKATPWGEADYEYQIVPRAVTRVTTPTHGGWMISKGWAEKNLSRAALDEAMVHGNYYAYEEDLAYIVPANESDAIFLAVLRGNDTWTPESLRAFIASRLETFYPEYVAKKAGTFTGVTSQSLNRGDKLTDKEGSVYTFLSPYKGKLNEWLVNKVQGEGDKWGCRSGVYRLSWETVSWKLKQGGTLVRAEGV